MEEIVVKLTDDDIRFLQNHYPSLHYDTEKNVITGILNFDVRYRKLEVIKDEYKIEINLNRILNGVPIVREIGGRILNIAKLQNKNLADLHINKLGEMCIIIPPKAKEKYPNGFDIIILFSHLEEHLYWISYVEKHNKEPWKAYGHGSKGYIELYLEDKNKYTNDVINYFRYYS